MTNTCKRLGKPPLGFLEPCGVKVEKPCKPWFEQIKLNKLGGRQVGQTTWLSRFTNHATTKVFKPSTMVTRLHEHGDLQVTQIWVIIRSHEWSTARIQKLSDYQGC